MATLRIWAMKRLMHRSKWRFGRGKICNWGDMTRLALSKKEQKLFNSIGKSYGMFKPLLRTPFPGMHEHFPLRLGLGPRYAR